jgi:hypothetical protein
MARFLTVCIAAAFLSFPTLAHAQAGPSDDPFLGAAGCTTCHAEVAAAWSKTKHARAMDSLSGNDRTNSTCVSCHITAKPGTVNAQLTNPHHPNVQCEACHGAGRDHAAQAATGTPALAGMIRTPDEKVCLGCHNSKSPSFKGFFYAGMKGLVHKH